MVPWCFEIFLDLVWFCDSDQTCARFHSVCGVHSLFGVNPCTFYGMLYWNGRGLSLTGSCPAVGLVRAIYYSNNRQFKLVVNNWLFRDKHKSLLVRCFFFFVTRRPGFKPRPPHHVTLWLSQCFVQIPANFRLGNHEDGQCLYTTYLSHHDKKK